MICPNCKCEIGNLSVCPYCGVQVQLPGGTKTIPITMQQPRQQQVYVPDLYQQGKQNRHFRNIDTWGLMTVILLAGMFVMQLLEIVLLILK